MFILFKSKIRHFDMDGIKSNGSELILHEGKYEGKTMEYIYENDKDYIIFLSMKKLNTKSRIKYKDFFDRIPAIVQQAQKMIENEDISNQYQPQQVRYPGNWRGW